MDSRWCPSQTVLKRVRRIQIQGQESPERKQQCPHPCAAAYPSLSRSRADTRARCLMGMKLRGCPMHFRHARLCVARAAGAGRPATVCDTAPGQRTPHVQKSARRPVRNPSCSGAMVAEGTAKTTPQKRWAGTLLSVRGVAWHYMYAREACSQEKMNSGAPIDSGAGCAAGKRAQLQYPRTPSVIQTGRLLAAGNRQRRHTSSSAQSAELTRPRCWLLAACFVACIACVDAPARGRARRRRRSRYISMFKCTRIHYYEYMY